MKPRALRCSAKARRAPKIAAIRFTINYLAVAKRTNPFPFLKGSQCAPMVFVAMASRQTKRASF
jgi:hypothetical protein